jgi:hypothetical protein
MKSAAALAMASCSRKFMPDILSLTGNRLFGQFLRRTVTYRGRLSENGSQHFIVNNPLIESVPARERHRAVKGPQAVEVTAFLELGIMVKTLW